MAPTTETIVTYIYRHYFILCYTTDCDAEMPTIVVKKNPRLNTPTFDVKKLHG